MSTTAQTARPSAPILGAESISNVPTGLLIGGRWVDALDGGEIETTNPSTGQPLTRFPAGGPSDVDVAVRAARAAFESGPWATGRPLDRQRILIRLAALVDEHADELGLLDALEMGMPIAKAVASARRAANTLLWFAAAARSSAGRTIENSLPDDYFSYTRKEPIGVVGAITPWNGPIGSAVCKIGPVLATGCTVVLKPAEDSSLSALRLGQLCLEAGVPDGVVNVVPGPGEITGVALVSHPDVDKITFTGSTAVGRDIVRASAGNLKRLSLELGGKSPNIVFADADLEAAALGAMTGAFGNSGQVCFAGTRLFVERPIFDEFVGAVGDLAGALRLGVATDPQTDLGPLASHAQLHRVMGYIEAGRAAGARTRVGGDRMTDGGLADGYFVPPTIFTEIGDAMTISREEIFGPVMCAAPFDSIEEVTARANDTRYGLGAGVWSQSSATVQRMTATLRAGTVWANCYLLSDPAVPFGGYKMSGQGREFGSEQLDELLEVKSVWIKA